MEKKTRLVTGKKKAWSVSNHGSQSQVSARYHLHSSVVLAIISAFAFAQTEMQSQRITVSLKPCVSVFGGVLILESQEALQTATGTSLASRVQ